MLVGLAMAQWLWVWSSLSLMMLCLLLWGWVWRWVEHKRLVHERNMGLAHCWVLRGHLVWGVVSGPWLWLPNASFVWVWWCRGGLGCGCVLSVA